MPGGLRIQGKIAFEQQRSAWAGGYWPTLDLVVEDEDAPVRLYVESKCTEFLRSGEAAFSKAFVKHAKQRLGKAAAETYERLAHDAGGFDPLDARQLAKHFLAAKRAVVESSGSFEVVVLCIWWEPKDASEYPVFKKHREAIRRFAAAVPDDNVTIHGMTYRELWDYWER